MVETFDDTAPDEQELQVCYCDFDGCLHDDAVYWHPKRGIYLGTPGRFLFEWMHILDELLHPHPTVKIVLSTDWARKSSYRFARAQLSPALQSRVIGATFHNRHMRADEFDHTSRGQQVLDDVERRRPTKWFAIDNDAEGWPDRVKDRLVLTHDRLGLSELRVQAEIREILRTYRR